MTARTDSSKPTPEPPPSTQAFTSSIRCTVGGVGLNTAWSYAIDLPCSVKLTIRTRDDVDVIWEFARSLLTDLTRPAGLGDVNLAPVDNLTTEMRLRSPDGAASLWFDTEDLRQFRNKAYALCLPAEEPEPDLTELENVLRAAAEHAGGDW